MPRGNKKGPLDEGPHTGRGLGYCTGHDEPGCSADSPHMGGAGRGMGRGMGHGNTGPGCRGRRHERRHGCRHGHGQGMGRGRGRGQGMGQGTGPWDPTHRHDLKEQEAPRPRIQERETQGSDQTEES